MRCEFGEDRECESTCRYANTCTRKPEKEITEAAGYQIGDEVICIESGVIGKIIQLYVPTTCEMQIMVETMDMRKYHAPISKWKKLKKGKWMQSASMPAAVSCAMPLMRTREDDIKEEIEKQIAKQAGLGLTFGA